MLTIFGEVYSGEKTLIIVEVEQGITELADIFGFH